MKHHIISCILGLVLGVILTLVVIKDSNFKIRPVRHLDTKNITEMKLHVKHKAGDTVVYNAYKGHGDVYDPRKVIVVE